MHRITNNKRAVFTEKLIGVLVLLFGISTGVVAQEDLSIAGGVTVVGQRINDAALATNGSFREEPPELADDKANGASIVYSIDVEMEKPFEFGVGYIHFVAAEGDPVFDGSNADAEGSDFGQNLGVSEAWFALNLFEELLSFKIGKIDPATIYDTNEVANDPTSQFMADVLVNNAAFLQPGYQPGMNFSLNFEVVTVDLGFFQDVGALPAEPIPGEMEYIFVAGEVGLHYDLFDNPGNFRIGFFSSGANDRTGFLMNMDQAFFDEVFSLFWRFGAVSGFDETLADAEVETSSAFSMGAQIVLFEAHRIGIAFSLESPSLDTAIDPITEDIVDSASRTWFEIYADFEIEEGVNFAIDLQAAGSPSYLAEEDTAAIFGFRVQASF